MKVAGMRFRARVVGHVRYEAKAAFGRGREHHSRSHHQIHRLNVHMIREPLHLTNPRAPVQGPQWMCGDGCASARAAD